MTDLSRERERVLQVIEVALQNSNNYELDNIARELLDLPDRPPGADPFVGWLTPETVPQGMNISQDGINFIKRWEGLRLNAYRCPAMVWTIGYGHTKTARRGMRITEPEAERLLRQDVKVYEYSVQKLVKVTLNQNQYDALVSFCFNVGRGAFAQSTLLRVLNQSNYQRTAKEFHKWVHAGNKVLPGLVSRRKAESYMFLKK